MELIFEERASKGIIKDYYVNRPNINKQYSNPPYVYKTMLDMSEADPVLSTALDLTVDLVTHKGYSFLSENQKSLKQVRKRFDEELDFDRVIDNVIYQFLIYGDAYLEVRWNEQKTKVMEIHPLETSEMVIDFGKHGEVAGYWQRTPGKGINDWVRFDADEVVHFRNKWVGAQMYSRAPFAPINRAFSTKIRANDYLQQIFLNIPPRMIYFLKSASDKQRKEFMENLLRAKTNPLMDVISSGEDFKGLAQQSVFDDGLIKILDHLRREILMVTRVPPHWVGLVEGINRGIGENVIIPYETKIKKIQREIASQINKELMPALGYSNVKIQFNAMSLMDEDVVVKIAGQLSAMNFDSETIIDYLRNHGIELREGAEIEKPELNEGVEEMDEEGIPGKKGPQIQNESAPSRARENAKVNKQTNDLNKKGVRDKQ